LGKESLSKISINYEKVSKGQFDNLDDLIVVAGYAWPSPVNGEYPKTEGAFNHSWMNFIPAHHAFDNYLDDGKQGDFIKKLSPDYDFFDWGYRIIISLSIHEQHRNILVKLVEVLKNYLAIISREAGSIVGAIFAKRERD
jgi:hypothetical protein